MGPPSWRGHRGRHRELRAKVKILKQLDGLLDADVIVVGAGLAGLVAAALDNGGSDNVTVVLVRSQ